MWFCNNIASKTHCYITHHYFYSLCRQAGCAMFGLNALFETSIVLASTEKSHRKKRRLFYLFFFSFKLRSNLRTKNWLERVREKFKRNSMEFLISSYGIFNSTKYIKVYLEINSVDVLALRWQYILLFIYRVSQIYDILLHGDMNGDLKD